MADVEWYRVISKHEHHPRTLPKTYPCDRPWSAQCQSDHDMGDGTWRSRICWCTDYPTQPEAWAALEKHLHENACDPGRDQWWEQPRCRTTAKEVTR